MHSRNRYGWGFESHGSSDRDTRRFHLNRARNWHSRLNRRRGRTNRSGKGLPRCWSSVCGWSGDRRQVRQYRARQRTLGMLGLRCSGRSSASAELFTRRFAGPRTRINIADDTQPLFGFRERREVTHVETKTLAALLKAPAHEEGKTLQLFFVRLGERHRRRRRAQIQNERSRVSSRRCRRVTSVRTPEGARRQIWRR